MVIGWSSTIRIRSPRTSSNAPVRHAVSTSPSNARGGAVLGGVGDRVAVVARRDALDAAQLRRRVRVRRRVGEQVEPRVGQVLGRAGGCPGPRCSPTVSVTVLHRRARSRLLSVTTSVAPAIDLRPAAPPVSVAERRPSRRRADRWSSSPASAASTVPSPSPAITTEPVAGLACTIGFGSLHREHRDRRRDLEVRRAAERLLVQERVRRVAGRLRLAERRRLTEPGRRRVEQAPEERRAGSPGSARTAGRCAARCRRRS